MNEKLIKVNDEKSVFVPIKKIDYYMEKYEISEQEAIQLWLEDNDILENEEIEERTEKAKEVMRTVHKARKNATNKRVAKKDEQKIELIKNLYEYAKTIEKAQNVTIANEVKEVDFEIDGVIFTFSLIKHRKGWTR